MNSELLQSCVLCGQRCRVNRLAGQLGQCRAGINPEISSFCVHHGEEPMISGSRGSGTIFFANCCLKCVYCQNYQISQEGKGVGSSVEELAEIMLELQAKGCHNINLVSPTHYGAQVIEALDLARGKGLRIPIVYNSGGYDSIELLKALKGKIDVYLPDFKYYNDDQACKYSGAKNYVATAKTALAEMFRQVGNIELNGAGVAERGVLVRHLVLPNNISDSEQVLGFLAALSKDIWVSLMAQYSPQFRAKEFPELNRRLRPDEYQRVIDYAQKIGLHNLYIQALDSSENFLPDFDQADPFAGGASPTSSR